MALDDVLKRGVFPGWLHDILRTNGMVPNEVVALYSEPIPVDDGKPARAKGIALTPAVLMGFEVVTGERPRSGFGTNVNESWTSVSVPTVAIQSVTTNYFLEGDTWREPRDLVEWAATIELDRPLGAFGKSINVPFSKEHRQSEEKNRDAVTAFVEALRTAS